ncbi:unannotated protein [freshwater metagenome]|uniref:Unannotated protein n=1 Tax=freshwater metagenome TaxID=449393 RepID=A0A6J7IYR8_9ZZZZ
MRRASPFTRKRASSSVRASSAPGRAASATAASPSTGSTSESLMSIPTRWANGCARSMTRRASSRTSTWSASSTAAPASKREISSRSTRSDSNRSNCACSNSAARAVGASKLARSSNITSAAMRIVVSGVRNSCETSDTNRCCTRDNPSSCLIWRCKLAAMSLNEAASCARSSSPLTRTRSDKKPSENRLAVWAAARTGATTCLVTNQATNARSPTSRTPVATTAPRTRSRVCCSCTSGNR